MGLFDSLLNTALSGGGDKQQILTGLVGQMLSGHSSAPGAPQGIAALIERFQKNGLGDLVGSWVGTGPNQPATPADIQQGLGAETMQHFSQQTGLGVAQVASLLATLLPQLISALTPKGSVPPAQDLPGMLTGLLNSLGK